MNFRQLFVNEKRATRARYPNADATNPFLYATGGDMDHLMIAPELVKPSWGLATDAQINIVPQWKFFNQWNTITKVDAAAAGSTSRTASAMRKSPPEAVAKVLCISRTTIYDWLALYRSGG